MTSDKYKYSATWVSYSSINDFLKCPRLYYLHNIYRDPKTGRKINLINPSLALGQIIHEVLEDLSFLKTEDRMKEPLITVYEAAWEKIQGKKGGFTDKSEEETIKEHGRQMLQRIQNNPGPLLRKAIKIRKDLPNYYLSIEDDIILCGKIDWLEYLPESDSVHVIDFKTGKHEEKADSLQLPIYHLLVHNCQKRNVTKASYWYLDKADSPSEVSLPDLEVAKTSVLDLARRVKLARTNKEFHCPTSKCRECEPYEAILRGDGEFVGVGEYNQDIYVKN